MTVGVATVAAAAVALRAELEARIWCSARAPASTLVSAAADALVVALIEAGADAATARRMTADILETAAWAMRAGIAWSP